MKFGIILVVYGLFAFVLMRPERALIMIFLISASAAGVMYFTKARSVSSAFAWFKRFPLRGVLVCANTALLTLYGISNKIEPIPELLLNAALFFMWFWMFLSFSTFRNKSGE